jgi:phosphoribosylanthranilate isomerase
MGKAIKVSRVQVKICGITTEADANLAAALGADAIGLNFYAGSPRYVSKSEAKDILRTVPSSVEPVGIFVNESVAFIDEELHSLPQVRTVQWHAEQSVFLTPVPFRMIPAFAVEAEADLLAISDYLAQAESQGVTPTAILVDARVQGLHGGTGKTAPWELLAEFRPGVPLILAGGLTPVNVAEAIRLVQPYGVDVASGVERTPGVKDPEKLRRFIAAIRGQG